jgi:hypothetical protein
MASSDCHRQSAHIGARHPLGRQGDASKLGSRSVPGTRWGGAGARHPLGRGGLLANGGLDLVPGTRCGARGMLANWGLDRCQAPVAARGIASKLGSGSGARHPLRRQGDASKLGSRSVPGTRCGAGDC